MSRLDAPEVVAEAAAALDTNAVAPATSSAASATSTAAARASSTACVLITGLPRGGTTIACELLNELPDVRALDEPMDVIGTIARASAAGTVDIGAVAAEIEAFAAEQRDSILHRGVARSKHVQGRVLGAKVSDRREGDGSGPRVRLVEIGEIAMAPPAAPDFVLAIKHPVAFAALLDGLCGRFAVFAIVRNPLSVLASWDSVPMAVRDGRLGLPAAVAPDIARRLEQIDDRLQRQIELLLWFYERFAEALPDERVIRYEDIVASGGGALAPIVTSARALRQALASRNAASVYDRAQMRAAAQALLDRDGPHWRWYAPEDVHEVLDAAGVTVRP